MLKKLSILLISVFFLQNIYAQNFSHKFGEITDFEKQMTSYSKDTTAEAVIIYDSGESGFFRNGEGFELYFKRHKKIKVLKESYINNANFSIPIYKGNRGKEELISFKATTYNIKNGQLIRKSLSKGQLFTETINKYWDNLKFAMPDVQVGSIIEFEYEISSPYKFMLQDWEFQSSIPTIFSEYTVKMIPFYAYQMSLQGANKFDIRNSFEEKGLKKQYHAVQYRDMVHYFAMRDIPAFKDESFITSRDNYIVKLDFQLSQIHQYGGGTINILSTWKELVKDLEKDEDFGAYVKKSKNKFKKIAETNNILSKDDTEKMNFTINYIKQNFNWNNYNGLYAQKKIKTFLKEKTGSASQINLFLVGALKAAEIEAYPVIISTRSNGKIIRTYPFLDPFNYVLAYANINGKWKLLDATDTYCPNNKIPIKCINDIGLIINKKEDVKWIKIQRHEVALIQTKITSKLSNDLDTLIGNFEVVSKGYSAMSLRKKFRNKIEKLEKQLEEDGLELLDSISTENYDDVDKPYIIKHKSSCLTENIAGKVFIHPFFNDVMQDNPLKQKTRTYPIDMVYPKSQTYINEMQVPDNYKVEKLPKDYFFNSSLFLIQYKCEEKDGIIKTIATYQFKKAVYPPEDYSKIKHYFNLIIEKFNQKIVLVKK